MEPDRETLAQQFDAQMQLLNTFYEWRHKVMTRFAVSVAALAVGLRWAYGHEASQSAFDERNLRALLFAAGAVVSLSAGLLDWRNQRIIDNCYAQGAAVEKLLKVADYGLFQSMSILSKSVATSYRLTLGLVYFGSAIVFTFASMRVLFS